jgi:hypothetical protein
MLVIKQAGNLSAPQSIILHAADAIVRGLAVDLAPHGGRTGSLQPLQQFSEAASE